MQIMDFLSQYHEIAAAVTARLFLGVLFFQQGYDAVFNIGVKNVISTYRQDFTAKGLPASVIGAVTVFACYTELICGAMLVLGLFEYGALYLLAVNLITAATGFGINTPMWDTRHVMPRLMLLLFLLVVPAEWHGFSLDNLILNK
jgi:putative oxidoreductase